MSVVVPSFVLAAFENATALIQGIRLMVGMLIPLAFALAVLAFFWGVAKYIFAAGQEDAIEEGRRIMIGGLIALFVIASVWGLVRWLQDELDIVNLNPVAVPTIMP